MEEKRLSLIKVLLRALLKVNISANKFEELINNSENHIFNYIEINEQIIPTDEIADILGISNEEELDKFFYYINEFNDEKNIDTLIEKIVKDYKI